MTEWQEERNKDQIFFFFFPNEKPENKILKQTFTIRIFSARCSWFFSSSSKVYPTHIHGHARSTPDSSWEHPGEQTRKCPTCAETWRTWCPLQSQPLPCSIDIPPAWGNPSNPCCNKVQVKDNNVSPTASTQSAPLHLWRTNIYGKKICKSKLQKLFLWHFCIRGCNSRSWQAWDRWTSKYGSSDCWNLQARVLASINLMWLCREGLKTFPMKLPSGLKLQLNKKQIRSNSRGNRQDASCFSLSLTTSSSFVWSVDWESFSPFTSSCHLSAGLA